MEKRTMALKLKLIAKNAQLSQNRFTRAERRLKESLRRTIAYGRVTKENNISKLMGSPAYKDALNRSYTYHALRFHLVEMLSKMEPGHRRDLDVKRRVEVAREEFQEVIDRNLATILSPRTLRRQEEMREKQRKDEEMKRKYRRWMPQADPVPPIEESLLAQPTRELTLIKTKGITTKAHFRAPDSPRHSNSPRNKNPVDDLTRGLDKLIIGPTKKALPPIASNG